MQETPKILSGLLHLLCPIAKVIVFLLQLLFILLQLSFNQGLSIGAEAMTTLRDQVLHPDMEDLLLNVLSRLTPESATELTPDSPGLSLLQKCLSREPKLEKVATMALSQVHKYKLTFVIAQSSSRTEKISFL